MNDLTRKFQQFLQKFKDTNQLFKNQESNQYCITKGISLELQSTRRTVQIMIVKRIENLNCTSGLDPP